MNFCKYIPLIILVITTNSFATHPHDEKKDERKKVAAETPQEIVDFAIQSFEKVSTSHLIRDEELHYFKGLNALRVLRHKFGTIKVFESCSRSSGSGASCADAVQFATEHATSRCYRSGRNKCELKSTYNSGSGYEYKSDSLCEDCPEIPGFSTKEYWCKACAVVHGVLE